MFRFSLGDQQFRNKLDIRNEVKSSLFRFVGNGFTFYFRLSFRWIPNAARGNKNIKQYILFSKYRRAHYLQWVFDVDPFKRKSCWVKGRWVRELRLKFFPPHHIKYLHISWNINEKPHSVLQNLPLLLISSNMEHHLIFVSLDSKRFKTINWFGRLKKKTRSAASSANSGAMIVQPPHIKGQL